MHNITILTTFQKSKSRDDLKQHIELQVCNGRPSTLALYHGTLRGKSVENNDAVSGHATVHALIPVYFETERFN